MSASLPRDVDGGGNAAAAVVVITTPPVQTRANTRYAAAAAIAASVAAAPKFKAPVRPGGAVAAVAVAAAAVAIVPALVDKDLAWIEGVDVMPDDVITLSNINSDSDSETENDAAYVRTLSTKCRIRLATDQGKKERIVQQVQKYDAINVERVKCGMNAITRPLTRQQLMVRADMASAALQKKALIDDGVSERAERARMRAYKNNQQQQQGQQEKQQEKQHEQEQKEKQQEKQQEQAARAAVTAHAITEAARIAAVAHAARAVNEKAAERTKRRARHVSRNMSRLAHMQDATSGFDSSSDVFSSEDEGATIASTFTYDQMRTRQSDNRQIKRGIYVRRAYLSAEDQYAEVNAFITAYDNAKLNNARVLAYKDSGATPDQINRYDALYPVESWLRMAHRPVRTPVETIRWEAEEAATLASKIVKAAALHKTSNVLAKLMQSRFNQPAPVLNSHPVHPSTAAFLERKNLFGLAFKAHTAVPIAPATMDAASSATSDPHAALASLLRMASPSAPIPVALARATPDTARALLAQPLAYAPIQVHIPASVPSRHTADAITYAIVNDIATFNNDAVAIIARKAPSARVRMTKQKRADQAIKSVQSMMLPPPMFTSSSSSSSSSTRSHEPMIRRPTTITSIPVAVMPAVITAVVVVPSRSMIPSTSSTSSSSSSSTSSSSTLSSSSSSSSSAAAVTALRAIDIDTLKQKMKKDCLSTITACVSLMSEMSTSLTQSAGLLMSPSVGIEAAHEAHTFASAAQEQLRQCDSILCEVIRSLASRR